MRIQFVLLSVLPQHFIGNEAFATLHRNVNPAFDSSGSQREIEKLLETDQILAINKPRGIPHHDNPSSEQLGIVTMLRHQLGDDHPRIYGIHRLDAVTSGILVFAKDSATAGNIQRLFRERKVVKLYIGISSKKPKKKQGLVNGYMVRSRRSGWMLRRTPSGEDDKTSFASTRFYTAGIGHISDEAKTLVLFQPLTGKTHQLRVAAKALGMPLYGDPLYASQTLGGRKVPDRTFLHATALHIPSDQSFSGLTVWSPPPFGSVISDSGSGQNLQAVVHQLVEKHCACPAINAAI